MTNLEKIAYKLNTIYAVKRTINKGEKVFKGNEYREKADIFELSLIDLSLEYERNDFKTMTIFTFPSEVVEVLETTQQ